MVSHYYNFSYTKFLRLFLLVYGQKHPNETSAVRRCCCSTRVRRWKDYNPEQHLDLLFESLCNSTNFEPNKIKEISQKSQEELKDKTSKDLLKLLKDKFTSKVYPSRILNLGLYILISNSKDFRDKNETERNKIISDIFEKLNLSYSKAEKDIGIYESSISKMEQAKELIKELKVKDMKKVKKQ